MLPEDARWRKEAMLDSSIQMVLLDHFNANDTQVILYSDKAFEAVAIEWLVKTNQVCHY